jgi:hypothetical protein
MKTITDRFNEWFPTIEDFKAAYRNVTGRSGPGRAGDTIFAERYSAFGHKVSGKSVGEYRMKIGFVRNRRKPKRSAKEEPRTLFTQEEQARDTVATTVYMDLALARRARFLVAYYPGLTLSGLFAAAIEREVDWREMRDNGGEPFPEPDGRHVRRGRPFKNV